MNFLNTLTPVQWLIFGLVPPAILALYFLKLKRQPLEVPSTYLWSRTIEDLHVNSIWQRLRQSLLLFLQLLLLALLILACLRPGWRGTHLTGNRFIFLVDTSASMSATDVKPTRLEAAKQQLLDLVEQMKSNDVALVISFADVARVEQSFTNSRSLLRQKLSRIQPTQRTSDLREALRAAAGLANPGRTSEAGNTQDVQVAEALPATLFLATDGGFAAVPEFSLGNLAPQYLRIGEAHPRNVAIAAFHVERNPEKPAQLQAFARLENYSDQNASVKLSLYLDQALIDASSTSVSADGNAGVQFDLPEVQRGVLRLVVEHADDLALDNTAYATIQTARQARVLLVTPGNDTLRIALETAEVRKSANVALAAPADLNTKQHQDLAAAGYYDLIIYDQCAPPPGPDGKPHMPQANTLFLGQLPPLDTWARGAKQANLAIIDIDRVHPLMQFIEMGDVAIAEGRTVKPPTGGAVLLDANVGPVLAIGPRDGLEDAVLGFDLIGTDDKGRVFPNTDWPRRRSFPLFLINAVRYLGGARSAVANASVKPGQPIVLRTETPVDRLRVRSPDGKFSEVARETQNTYTFSNTDLLGIYEVFEPKAQEPSQRFAVNLFDRRESDLRPRDKLELGHEEIPGQGSQAPARLEAWRWLLIAGIVVLVFEWYVYNRRVYF